MVKINFPRSYIVWDLETTGFDPINDRIVEVGVAIVRDGLVIDQWSSLINFEGEMSEGAFAAHGISKEMCEKEGKPEREVIARLFQNILDCEAHVTHNGTRFDIPFLKHAMILLQQENGSQMPVSPGDILRENHIDTAAIYKGGKMGEAKDWKEGWHEYFYRVLSKPVKGLKYNVDTCCEEFGIPIDEMTRHRALGDVLLTQRIYEFLTVVY